MWHPRVSGQNLAMLKRWTGLDTGPASSRKVATTQAFVAPTLRLASSPADVLHCEARCASFSAATDIDNARSRLDKQEQTVNLWTMPKRLTELPDTSHFPRQEPMGWTIYDSHWQVEQIGKNDEIMEKIAYTNFFFAAEAAYNAALIAMPHDRILFRNRMRVIRKSWET